MNRFLVLILGILFCMPALLAENEYKILNMTSDQISYRGKKCHVNDVIQYLFDIEWSNQDDAMQLVDLNNNEQIIWSARKQNRSAMARNGLKNKAKLSSGMLMPSKLSSRALIGLPELIAELNDVVLFDEWRVYTMFPTTDQQWFELELLLPDGLSKRVKLDGSPNGDLVIKRTALSDVLQPSMQASMFFISDGKQEVLVSDNVKINVVNGVNVQDIY